MVAKQITPTPEDIQLLQTLCSRIEVSCNVYDVIRMLYRILEWSSSDSKLNLHDVFLDRQVFNALAELTIAQLIRIMALLDDAVVHFQNTDRGRLASERVKFSPAEITAMLRGRRTDA